MRKILAGFILAVVIGIPAIYFSLPIWAERQALREVKAAFVTMGGTGGKASHGAMSFDIWTRTLKVSDVAIELDNSGTVLKAVQIVAVRASSPASGRFAAERIELTDLEVAGLHWAKDGLRTTYRAPKITLEDFSGPAALQKLAAPAGTEAGRLLLDTATKMSASLVSIPALSATLSLPMHTGPSGAGPAEYGVTALTLRDVTEGRVATVTADRITMTGRLADLGATTADIESLKAEDLDLNAIRAAFDAERRPEDSYRQVYNVVTTGAYRFTFENAGAARFDATRLETFSIKPGVLADPEIFNLGSALLSGTMPLAAMRATYDKLAMVYEGIAFGKFEARGLNAKAGGDGNVKVDTLRAGGFEAGALAELAVEGVDIRLPAAGPVTVERAAIKSIDIVTIMRNAARMQMELAPSLEQSLAVLTMFSGIELKGLSLEPSPGQTSRVDNLSFSWGNFVGAIPSKIRAGSQFSATIDPQTTDRTLRYLLDAGIKRITAIVDVGADWSESAKSLDIAPLVAEFANVYGASAKLTVNNVPRSAFAGDAVSLMLALPQFEAGTMELSMRDLGGLELVFAQLAKDQQVTPEFARKTTAEAIRAYATMNAEAQALGPAIARFIETPNTTLNILLTPTGRVGLLNAIASLRSDPTGVLSQFKIEASTEP